MPMTINQFRQLAAYNRWANARLYAAALDLSDQAYRLHIGVVFGCACRKSNPNILVVQPAQDRAAKNGPGQFDGARDRRILLQR